MTTATTQTSRFVVEPAAGADDAGVRALLRRPLGGAMRVALTRSPDTRLAAGVEGERHQLFVARDTLDAGRIVGCGSRSVRLMCIGGEVRRVGYLGLLRRDERVIGYRRLLADGFAMCDAARRGDEEPYDLTAIVSDNAAARRLLERGIRGMPRYTPIGQLTTMLVAPRRAARRRARVERGTGDMLNDIAACLQRSALRRAVGPWWTADDLRSPVRCRGLDAADFAVVLDGSRVVGCAALWDQRSFKQVIVEGYDARITRWRRAINAVQRLRGGVTLPAPGRSLQLAYASHLAVDDDDNEVAMALIDAVRERASGFDAVAIGLASEGAVAEALRRRVCVMEYRSAIYAVGGEPGWHRDAASGRVQMEVATL